MKKFLSIVLSIMIMTTLFSGCKKNDNGQDSEQNSTPVQPTPTPKMYYQNPLTGQEKQAGYQDEKSPLAVMVNNIMSNTVENAWPQSGLSDADVIYEMETEGGITRYMALYSDYDNIEKIGPIRSARDQFVKLMIPSQALYAHVGGSSYAKDMLTQYGWGDRDIDGYSKNITFVDNERLAIRSREHCSFISGELINAAVEKFNLSNTNKEINLFNWVKYDEPARVLAGGDANEIFWRFSTLYDTVFSYDEQAKTYTKQHRYIPQNYQKTLIDTNYGEKPVEFDNVFVLWTQIEKYPDTNAASGFSSLSKVDMDFGGIGYYFSGGKYEKVRWIKGLATDRLRIVDKDGHEKDIAVNTGKSYVAFVDLDYFGTFKIDDTLIDEAGDYTPNEEILPTEDNKEVED